MLDLCKAIDCVPVATKGWAWPYGSRDPHVLGQWAVEKWKELGEPLDTAPHSLLVRKFWLKQTGKACYVPCAPLHLLHLLHSRAAQPFQGVFPLNQMKVGYQNVANLLFTSWLHLNTNF